MSSSTIEQCVYLSRFDHALLPCPPSSRPTAIETASSRAAPTRRVYACPIAACNKTFRRRFSLKEHVATHTGEKAFVCSVSSCRRGFSTSGNLSRHKRVQHPWLDAPLECLVDDCGCTFASERKLERHMAMVHFSESSYPCTVKHCGRAFTTAGNLRRHMKQRHLEDEDTKIPEAPVPEPRAQATRSPTAVDCVKLEPACTHWSVESFTLGAQPTLYPDAELMDVLSCLFD